MKGFIALAKKEALEQRRTWKLAGMTGVYTGVAVLIVIVTFVVAEIRDESRDVEMAKGLLTAFGFTVSGLGTFLTIMIAMGSIANERSNGTAAMTLSKPVTRLAFVSTKFIGIIFSIYIALLISSGVMFVVTSLFIETWSAWRFFVFMAILGVYLVFTASVAFFWSGMFTRQIVAGGVAILIVLIIPFLSGIPRTQDYWPTDIIDWAANWFIPGEDSGGGWKSLLVSLGAIAALGSGAWLVFRRKEL